MKRERIGIFGGVFDPVHKGHTTIASAFLKSRLVQSLWVLPAPDPPHKRTTGITAFSHRVRMLELAFEGFNQVKIDVVESRLPKPSYTLQTLTYLQEQHPDTLFYLCMGEDSLLNFTTWYQYNQILEKTTLLVAERTGYGNRQKIPEKILESTVFTEHKPITISSTAIRRETGAIHDKKPDIPESVYHYIVENNLYRNHP